MPENTLEFPPEFSPDRVEDSLKRISVALITAHREGRRDVIARYARQAGIPVGEGPRGQGKLFLKTIQVYHPDRIARHLDRIRQCLAAGDHAGLAELRNLLDSRPASARIEGTADLEQEFVWDPADHGFHADNWEAHAAEAPLRTERARRRQRPISVLEALRREFFGNLDLDFSRDELENLDAELDLYDRGIGDLEGLQFCRNLTGLNLSCNSIFDVTPLKFLRRLEQLDLSNNDIDDADCLVSLKRLEELDISHNGLDGIGFLLEMPSLKVVNLEGVPRPDQAVITKLRERGVLVLV